MLNKKRTINCSGALVDLSSPIVMGILNITPDSFFDGGSYTDEKNIVPRAEKIIADGAAIIDVGAFSSRPGAELISVEEEKLRLKNALAPIRKEFADAVISVDTCSAEVARWCCGEFGVDIINDISGGEMDENMFQTIADLHVPYILMHMLGTPKDMQDAPSYSSIMKEITLYFAKKVNTLRLLGVNDIILDPGFGFGKTLEHNFELLKKLNDFEMFELPMLVGISRKSMLYKTTGGSPQDALAGTVAANTLALERGADILRVHDVKEAVETIKVFNAFKKA